MGLNFTTEAEASAWVNRNSSNPVKKQIKPSLPGPIEFKNRYKNDWERGYASHLEQLKNLKQIIDWKYESFGYRLAYKTYIYIDFFIVYPDHFEFHDVKGELRAQWWAKVKVMKENFPYFKYATVKKVKGEWVVKYL